MDVLSKSNMLRRSYHASIRVRVKHNIEPEINHSELLFKSTALYDTKKYFEDEETMSVLLQKNIKITRRIPHEFYQNVHV